MGDHLDVCVDRLITSENINSQSISETSGLSEDGSCSQPSEPSTSVAKVTEGDENSVPEEEEPLIQMVECRICQEEDSMKYLEVPCACSGSLKYAHRKCVQRWCDEKGDVTCEICHQQYQPGYTAPPPRSDDTIIDMGEDWTISGAPFDLNDPRLLAMAAERHFVDAEYDEYGDTDTSGAAFCRSVALILIALLLLRHALTLSSGSDDEDDIYTFFSLFLLRAAGFLLPCYIMAWAISILQRRRQRQEAAALAAAEVAFMIHARQRQGMHFTIAPGPSPNHAHEAPPALAPAPAPAPAIQ